MGVGYGSECHLLRYLGRHRQLLDAKVLAGTGGDRIDWLDYPFDPTRTWLDGEWKGLDFLPAEHPGRQTWKTVWPQRGNAPNWDAIGQLHRGGSTEWLLVEAKANVEELRSACTAKKEGGLGPITAALDKAKASLGIDAGKNWLTGYYQHANRVAILQFLTEHGIPARLLFVYFVGDLSGAGRTCPRKPDEWSEALLAQQQHLGLVGDHPLESRISKVFLDVVPRGK
jgi:hypothetical protein